MVAYLNCVLAFLTLLFSMSRPRGAMGWSVVCGISLSYSLNCSYVHAHVI